MERRGDMKQQDLIEGYLKLNDVLLSGKGIKEIIDTANGLIGNPCFVCDIRLKIISYSSNTAVDDPVWLSVIEKGYASEKIASIMIEQNILARIHLSDEPVTITYNMSYYPWKAVKVSDGQRILGYLVFMECNKTCDEVDLLMIRRTASTLACEMQKDKYFSHSKGMMHEYLIADLLKGKITDHDTLKEVLTYLDVRFKENLYILTIRQRSDAAVTPIPILQKKLDFVITKGKSVILNDDIVFLISSTDTTPISASEVTKLKKILIANNYVAGLSSFFSDLLYTKEHYMEAVTTFQLGCNYDCSECFFSYDDLKLYPVVGIVAGHSNLDVFCHPLLNTLVEYDKNNNTEFVQTLYTYYLSGMNISKSAKSFFIHRNTMDYRISKINEILGMDIRDPDIILALYLSLKIMIYTKKINLTNPLKRDGDKE